MKPTPVPTPAEAVRLVFQRACMSISREYAFLAKSLDAPTPRQAAVSFVKARRARKS
jgi:hypothetical protein